MRCERFERLWLASEEGRIGPGGSRRLREHLGSCLRCRQLVEGMDALDHALEDLADRQPDAPVHLKARVLARVREGAGSAGRRRWALALWPGRLGTVGWALGAFLLGVLVARAPVGRQGPAGEPLQRVVIEFVDPDAQDVRLVGDFNAWGRGGGPLRVERHDGRWVFHLELRPGRYQYSFFVDGRKWLPDPNAPGIIPDGFGGKNSLLYVHVPTVRGQRVRSL